MRAMSERFEWVTDPARFAELAEPWQVLAAGEPTPFCDHAWYTAWWEAFGGETGLEVATWWRDDELAAALPLHARGRRLVTLTNDHSPLLRPLARDPEALTGLLAGILATGSSELVLDAIPADDAAVAGLGAELARGSRIVLVERRHVSPIVDTSGEAGASGGSSLRTLKRRRRKLEREHAVEFRFEDEPGDLDARLDRGFAVEASSWKGREGTAISSAADTDRFYRAIAHAFGAGGELRLAWLIVDGRPAAFNLCLARDRRLFLLKTGFDEAFARFTPGLILNLRIVEHCTDTDFDAYELLGAEARWKRELATTSRSHVRVRGYRRRPAPLARYAARRFGVPAARAILARADRARGALARVWRRASGSLQSAAPGGAETSGAPGDGGDSSPAT